MKPELELGSRVIITHPRLGKEVIGLITGYNVKSIDGQHKTTYTVRYENPYFSVDQGPIEQGSYLSYERSIFDESEVIPIIENTYPKTPLKDYSDGHDHQADALKYAMHGIKK